MLRTEPQLCFLLKHSLAGSKDDRVLEVPAPVWEICTELLAPGSWQPAPALARVGIWGVTSEWEFSVSLSLSLSEVNIFKKYLEELLLW